MVALLELQPSGVEPKDGMVHGLFLRGDHSDLINLEAICIVNGVLMKAAIENCGNFLSITKPLVCINLGKMMKK